MSLFSRYKQIKAARSTVDTDEERSGLFILHDQPANAVNSIDIVAVHGLGGHWKNTWSDENGNLWLRDFLPEQLKEAGISARIMSYGYNSDVAFSKAVTNIDDEAAMLLERLDSERRSGLEIDRGIIFVSHSLGGIIVKKTMIIAHERSKIYGSLLLHVKAMVFFGVPHRGSDSAYWATFAATLLKYGQIGFGTNTNFVTALQRNSKTFADISQQFVERSADVSIRTFYETEKMFNQLIVDRDSARLGLPNEIAVGIAGADHRAMTKFNSSTSQKYRPVWLAITKLCTTIVAAEEVGKSQPSPIKEVKNQPTPTNLGEEFRSSETNASLLTACLRLLLLTDPLDDLAAVSNERGHILNGSCEWVLTQQAYSEWLGKDGVQALKITGHAGIGKTTMIRFILRNLQVTLQDDPKSVVLYFFFDSRYADRQSSTAILRSLMFQFLRARPEAFEIISKNFGLQRDKFVQNFFTLWRNLCSLLQGFKDGTIYILTDALDESDVGSRDEFLRELASFPDSPGSITKQNIKILVTTRPELGIQNHFDDSWASLQVDSDKINADLSKYIDAKLNSLAEKKKYPEDLKKDIATALSEQAAGTFLWVSFILEDLSKANVFEVREKLKCLPSGLDGVYKRILSQIPTGKEQAAKFVLNWVVVAKSPLTTRELATAYGLHKRLWDVRHLPSQPQIEELTEVYRVCESLLFIDPKKETVNLLHQSVKDFLLSDELLKASSDIAKYAVDLFEAHFQAFEICWTYLSTEDFNHGTLIIDRAGSKLYRPERKKSTNSSSSDVAGQLFLNYVDANWTHHASTSGDRIIATGRWGRKELTNMPTIRDFWLFRTIRDGNFSLARMLLEQGADPDVHCDGSTSLHEAVLSNDTKTLEFLADSGANFDIKDDDGRSALFKAASLQNGDMTSLLRKHGTQLLSTKSRICGGTLDAVSHVATAEEVFDAEGRPSLEYLKNHFYQEGRLTEDVAISILERTTALLTKEPTLIEVEAPIVVCGQLLGQFYDIIHLFEVGGPPGEVPYLFLGDYVGKNYFGIESVLYLCALKICFPTKIHLLRGSHECEHLTDYFTFKKECLHKYSEKLYRVSLALFNSLPLAALLRQDSKSYLCVHGGIGPELRSVDDINKLDRFQEPPRDGTMADLLSSMAHDEYGNEPPGTAHFSANYIAGTSYLYTYEVICEFLEKNNLEAIISAHCKADAGYKFFRKTKKGVPSIISLFSAPNYLDTFRNKAAILQFGNNVWNFRQFSSSPHPFWLPGMKDVFTWSMPYVADNMINMVLALVKEEEEEEDNSVETVADAIETRRAFLWEEVLDLPSPVRSPWQDYYDKLKLRQNTVSISAALTVVLSILIYLASR